eukprot:SAG31_NODE_1696_length_7503_cov_45.737574_3_plen_119_part_00
MSDECGGMLGDSSARARTASFYHGFYVGRRVRSTAVLNLVCHCDTATDVRTRTVCHCDDATPFYSILCLRIACVFIICILYEIILKTSYKVHVPVLGTKFSTPNLSYSVDLNLDLQDL